MFDIESIAAPSLVRIEEATVLDEMTVVFCCKLHPLYFHLLSSLFIFFDGSITAIQETADSDGTN